MAYTVKRGTVARRRGSCRAARSIIPRLARWAGVGVFILGAAMLSCDGPTEPEYDGVWEVVATPKCLAGVRDICFVTPNDGWAVAGKYIWHYDGSSWKSFRTLIHENPLYDYALTQVWFNGPNDGWFAGEEARSQSDYSSRMWHYDGSNFKEVTIPDVRHIYKLWFNAPDDGWAFGGYYALRYDGVNWYKTEFPTLYWSGCFFWNSNDGWATSMLAIYRWDGVDWEKIKTVDNYLNCIGFATPSEGWAMGEWLEYESDTPVYRYDGKKWFNTRGPYTYNEFFNDVEFLSADYGWAVGVGTWHWDGEKWTRYDKPDSGEHGKGFDLNCVFCLDENDVWAGGHRGNIIHFKGFGERS